jgi:hypothetical protein
MATNPVVPVPNPVRHGDAEVLIGILSIVEGAIWAGDLNEQTTSKVAERFVQQGLLAADHDRQALCRTGHVRSRRARRLGGSGSG